MKVDAAFDALKKANPEPDPAALRRALNPKATDLIDSELRPRRPQTSSRPSRPRWRLVFAPGLAVLMVVLAMLVPWAGSQSVLDRLRNSPIDIASRYMEARNAYDPAAADRLLSDDAFLQDVPRIERGELALGFEALRIYGWQFESFNCENTPGASLVTCSYVADSRLSEIVGYTLLEGRIHFLVEDGEITSLVHDFNLAEYAPNVHERYVAWLNEVHPGVFDRIFVMNEGIATPILTDEALALADVYLEQYDRFLNG
jgi:hypothetical protein